MRMDTRIFPNLDSLSSAAMYETLAIVRDAITQRGRFAIALSGGHTPARMYELWASQPFRDETPWDRVHLFWGDERYVPHDDPLSNFGVTRETLISRVPIPPANVHPMPTLPGPPENRLKRTSRSCASSLAPPLSSIFNSSGSGRKATLRRFFRVRQRSKKSGAGSCRSRCMQRRHGA